MISMKYSTYSQTLSIPFCATMTHSVYVNNNFIATTFGNEPFGEMANNAPMPQNEDTIQIPTDFDFPRTQWDGMLFGTVSVHTFSR